MKNVFLAVALLVAGAAFGQKPNVKIDNAGNYVAIERAVHRDTATGRFYVDKDDNMFPVYRSRQGKLYALRVSKKGKTYKYYLKPDTETFDWGGN